MVPPAHPELTCSDGVTEMNDPEGRKRRRFLMHAATLGSALALAAVMRSARGATPGSGSEAGSLPMPLATDKCPVCGMFVAKYPEWIASVRHPDGTIYHFDGAKDLFKYLLEPGRYSPDRQDRPPGDAVVTEYYDLKRIDARTASYVIGSDVLGPMGHELVPLATAAEAEEFLRDHKGRRIVAFEEVDAGLLRALDAGRF
jgi:copper chaperone NosL